MFKCPGHDRVWVSVAAEWMQALDVGGGRYLLLGVPRAASAFKRLDVVWAASVADGTLVATGVSMRALAGGRVA